MITFKILSKEEAISFFDNKDFIEKSEIVGRDLEEVLYGYKFLGSTVDGSVVACTAIRPLTVEVIEAHTYILPKCRFYAEDCLLTHLQFAEKVGFKKVVTKATPLVKNFLIKRLGFKVVDQHLEKELNNECS